MIKIIGPVTNISWELNEPEEPDHREPAQVEKDLQRDDITVDSKPWWV